METSFYSWIRKGLGRQINEVDNLGAPKKSNSSNGCVETMNRPTVQLTAIINAKGLNKKAGDEYVTRTEAKTITLSGPGDVLSLNSNAILRVFPTPDSDAFPINEFPYVEFWEPDFAWRFTPAKAAEKGKLRPWLALVVCKVSECSIEKTSWGPDLVTFNVEKDEDYKKIFPLPEDVWKMAHAQGKGGQNAEICRILGIKKEEMEAGAEYRAFLIPVFEMGRLRGLRGPDYDEKTDESERSLNNVVAQCAAWEANLDQQMINHESPLTFPSYFSWSFRTGDLNFAQKVKSLVRNDAKKSGIDVDVTSLGEGLDYAVLDKKPKRDKINVPAAMMTVKGVLEEKYPNQNSDEKEVYDHLNSLLSKSPVFEENIKLTSNGTSSNNVDEDDPWVTPPIYGGKHILATSLDESKNSKTPWLTQINLDLHYRAAAGLGKKAVQRNQEELVNRAWKQIDAVKMLNAELNQKMLSTNVSDSVKYLNYSWAGKKDEVVDSKNEALLVAQMMKNLSVMKNAKFGKNKKDSGVSLANIMDAMKIPSAFASISFQNTTQKILGNIDNTTVLESIAKRNFYELLKLPEEKNTLDANLLSGFKTRLFPYLLEYLVTKSSLSLYFNCSGNNINHKKLEIVKKVADYSSWRSVDETVLHYMEDRSLILALQQKGSDEVKTDIINHKLWTLSIVGYTQSHWDNYRDDKKYNVYALEHSVFRNLFQIKDNTCVVKIAFPTPIYYVDVDKMTDEMSFYQVQNGIIKNAELHRTMKQTAYSIENLFLCRAKQTYTESDKQTLYNDFFDMPQIAVLKEAFLDPKKCCVFKNSEEFYQKISESFGGNFAILYSAWTNFTSVLSNYLRTYGTKKETIPSLNPDSNYMSKVIALKQGLRDDSVYGRLKECADTYYKTFFESNELRKNYLEDCLASKYPIKAYPIFPEPTYYYLKDIADEFILPGVEDLPEDSISMFKGNAAFVEAYLCGMNTEMGRELLWREYPTDQRGSYFKKFWDSETSIEDIKTENYFDVNSVHRWKKTLGANHVITDKGSKGDLLFFAIKSNLMKLYPDTRITLRKANCIYKENKSLSFRIMDGVTVENNGILEPVSQAFVRDDIYVAGFKIAFEDALGCFRTNNNLNSGYMLVFEKPSENVEFEIDTEAYQQNSAADFAVNSVVKTSIVGKHVLTLIGKN